MKYKVLVFILSFLLPCYYALPVKADSTCTGYNYVEDNSSSLKYTGDWTLDNNPVYGGTYSHGGSHSYTPSGSVEFSFTGTEIQFYGKTGPAAGTANIYIDNMTTPVKTIDQYTNDHTYQILWYQNLNLSNSEHKIKVSTASKNSNSTGTYLNVDYFVYQTCSSNLNGTQTNSPVPVTGTDWPTIMLLGVGSIIFFSSFLLAF